MGQARLGFLLITGRSAPGWRRRRLHEGEAVAEGAEVQGGLGGRRWLCQGSDRAQAGHSSRDSLGSVETGQDLNCGFAVPVA